MIQLNTIVKLGNLKLPVFVITACLIDDCNVFFSLTSSTAGEERKYKL